MRLVGFAAWEDDSDLMPTWPGAIGETPREALSDPVIVGRPALLFNDGILIDSYQLHITVNLRAERPA
jgi:hypothetical protein